jgi:hypothetical protein
MPWVSGFELNWRTKMGFQDYIVSQQAIDDAKAPGLSGDVEEQLVEMAKLSAILTYPNANRRYKQFAFNVKDGVVLSVVPFDLETN